MRIVTINCSESIETILPNGLKRWKKTEWAVNIEEHEDAELKSFEIHNRLEAVNRAVVNMQPASTWEGTLSEAEYKSFAPERIPTPIINLEKERVEILIDNAKSEQEIHGYWDKAVEHGLQDQWGKQLQSLQNK